jgi:hypothetical protein
MHDIECFDSDPFMDRDKCVQRLLDEYRTHKKLIVAVDFDDTVFDFHKANRRYDRVLNLLRRCQALNFYIMLFTGTHCDQYPTQIAFLESLGITVTCVNQNPIPLPFGNHGKPYFNILLDDRAGLGQAYVVLSSVVTEIEKEN